MNLRTPLLRALQLPTAFALLVGAGSFFACGDDSDGNAGGATGGTAGTGGTAALGAASAAGAGGNGGTADNGGAGATAGGGETGGSAAYAPYIDALCGFAERCVAEQGQGYESTQACKTHWTQRSECGPSFGEITPSELFACTAYLEALPCDMRLNMPGSPCAAVFQGGPTAATGELCYQDRFRKHLCDFGNYCPDPAPATCSACIAQFSVGENCNSNVECDTEFCDNGKCQPPIAAGQACDAIAPCFGFHICLAGGCVPLKADGANCVGDRECFIGAFCLNGKCERQPACARTEGQHCDSSQDCAADYYCQGPSFTCQPRIALDGDCTQGLEACVAGAYCNLGNQNLCKPLPQEGDACAAGYACPLQTFCNPTTECEALRPDGAACEAPEQCQSGACTSLMCGCS